MQSYLDLVLAAAVAQQVPSALGACLNSYASIDRRSAAEQAWQFASIIIIIIVVIVSGWQPAINRGAGIEEVE